MSQASTECLHRAVFVSGLLPFPQESARSSEVTSMRLTSSGHGQFQGSSKPLSPAYQALCNLPVPMSSAAREPPTPPTLGSALLDSRACWRLPLTPRLKHLFPHCLPLALGLTYPLSFSPGAALLRKTCSLVLGDLTLTSATWIPLYYGCLFGCLLFWPEN